MNSFDKIKTNAEQNHSITSEFVDQFLIYYAAAKDRLERKFERAVRPYRHIVSVMPKGWKGFLETQFIAHEIFKQGGLVRKYLNHSEINLRSDDELEYLKLGKNHPWRYSFCEVLDNPHPDFYTMHDLFTDEEYLLYSGGMSGILLEIPDVQTWFLLIGSDGMCMQTYGAIVYFKSFDRQDITFFARELDPDLESNTGIVEHIEQNPLPYSMLFAGAEYPFVLHKTHFIKHCAARYIDEDFSSEPFNDSFLIEYTNNLYRMKLKNWDEFPHFAVAYYDEEEATLHLTAMTRLGFEKLVEAVNNGGYDLPSEPMDAVSPAMLKTASDILKQEIKINPFDDFFVPKDDGNESLDGFNRYLRLLMDARNSGIKPDIRKMAEEAGIDYYTAVDLTEQVMKKIERM